jgi:hypothetical protein
MTWQLERIRQSGRKFLETISLHPFPPLFLAGMVDLGCSPHDRGTEAADCDNPRGSRSARRQSMTLR